MSASHGVIYSYAAGSTSSDPDGYRRVETTSPSRLPQLLATFAPLRSWIHSQSLIISAYPASLGLTGSAPLVDTYLHPPAFLRACHLAQRERRDVVFASQPLFGAQLIGQLCDAAADVPSRMLWAVGGYPLPQSLEAFIRRRLEVRGCELKVLQAYGVAEIGHTCFAAIERSAAGWPLYRQVAQEVSAEIVGRDHRLKLTAASGRSIVTGDRAERIDDHWRLTNGTDRVDPIILRQLDSWTDDHWKRRTGYLHATEDHAAFQLRPDHEPSGDQAETPFHEFWSRHGGWWTCKPRWARR